MHTKLKALMILEIIKRMCATPSRSSTTSPLNKLNKLFQYQTEKQHQTESQLPDEIRKLGRWLAGQLYVV